MKLWHGHHKKLLAPTLPELVVVLVLKGFISGPRSACRRILVQHLGGPPLAAFISTEPSLHSLELLLPG